MKGVAIILMIIGHRSDFGKSVIYSFHMPLFFILSGIYFTPSNPKFLLKKDFKRLIIPFIITSIILFLWSLYQYLRFDDNILIFRQIKEFIFPSGLNLIDDEFWKVGGMSIWFLMAMFWTRSVFNILSYKFSINSTLIIATLIGILAIIIDRNFFNFPFAILAGLGALIFFSIGQLYKINKDKKVIKYILVICSIFWIFYMIFQGDNLNLVMQTNRYRNHIFDFISAFGGVFMCWIITRYFLEKIPFLRNFLLFCGMNSLLILCVHKIEGVIPVKRIITQSYLNLNLNITGEIYEIVVGVIICLIVCTIGYYIPYAKKMFKIAPWEKY